MPATPAHDGHVRAQAAPLAAGCLAALGLWLMLPAGVITLNDDFGYYRSVLETAARGRPWTDDWLAPWSASLAVISAALFKLTGSFQLATHGLQAVGVGVAVFAVTRLLRRRGLTPWSAGGLALLIFTCPTLLWKGVEFTALAIYVPCLFLTLDAAGRDRWGLFTFWTAVALASRQSAVAWLAIPAIAGVQNAIARPRLPVKSWLAPALACGAGLAVYALCQVGMNSTHAQRIMIAPLWESLTATRIAQWWPFAALLALTSLGVAQGVLWLARPSAERWRSVPAFLLRGVLPAAGLVLLFCVRARFNVECEHPFFASTAGQFYLWLITALGALGWLIAPLRCDLRLLAGAFASIFLVTLRPATWDYYWIDAAALTFFAVRPLDPVALPARWPRCVTLALLGALLLVPAGNFVTRVKQTVDEFHAQEVILEKALRAGEITPADLSVASFGFAGWHLYPHFIRTTEGAQAYIADFQRYLHRDTLHWETRSADNPTPLADPATVVRSEVFPIGWRGQRHRFILRRPAPAAAAELPLDLARYRYQRFPLSDEEWRAATSTNR